MSEYDYVPCDVAIVAMTDKALKVETEFGGHVWVPKSVCEDNARELVVNENNAITLNVADWFAEKNDLI